MQESGSRQVNGIWAGKGQGDVTGIPQENGRDKIHSIQKELLNLGSSCLSLALSESQNSFGIMEYAELEVSQQGEDWKGKKKKKNSHPKTCLGINHS